MYVFARRQDYEQPDFIFAHHDPSIMLREAGGVVMAHLGTHGPTDEWPAMPIASASLMAVQRDVKEAPGLGPALKPVALWRVHDLYDYTVYEVVTGR